MNTYTLRFTQKGMRSAFDEWGCNCGPAALAFALQVPLPDVRYAIPGFDRHRYTSPQMMKSALQVMQQRYDVVSFNRESSDSFLPAMFHEQIALVRVQWCGPWTLPGANPKWTYRQTHWIATWDGAIEIQGFERRVGRHVFDVNSAVTDYTDWATRVVPWITGEIDRADGRWFPTHVWRFRSPEV